MNGNELNATDLLVLIVIWEFGYVCGILTMGFLMIRAIPTAVDLVLEKTKK